jgi:pimeloyl-ACP methyl ester carboxylesterase
VIEDADLSEPPVLIGHSLGGMLATVRAADSPDAARAVVNVDQTLRMTDFAAAVRPLRSQLEGDGFDAVMASFADMLGAGTLPPDTAARVRAYDRSKPEVVLGIWQALFEMSDEDLTALVENGLLPNLRVPYLAIHGPDPGADYVEWLTTRVPSATVEVWGGGHWVHLGDPGRFVNRVRDFVAAT